MSMNVNTKTDLHGIRNRNFLLFVSLTVVVILISSCFLLAFNTSSAFTSESSTTYDTVVSNEVDLSKTILRETVSNEMDLRAIVNNTVESTIILLDDDVVLTGSALIIPAGKNITLTSNSGNGFFKLVGASGSSVITVERGGVLNINGVIITHINGVYGMGVHVIGGTLIMNSGAITGNIVSGAGGGVLNGGVFSMFGGTISGNTASYGGGVYSNHASFSMFGGEIFGNSATNGGGVFNFRGNFDLYDGAVFGNVADEQGGGVYSYTAGSGNGNPNGSTGSFNIIGGAIYDNIVIDKNGNADVYNWVTW